MAIGMAMNAKGETGVTPKLLDETEVQVVDDNGETKMKKGAAFLLQSYGSHFQGDKGTGTQGPTRIEQVVVNLGILNCMGVGVGREAVPVAEYHEPLDKAMHLLVPGAMRVHDDVA